MVKLPLIALNCDKYCYGYDVVNFLLSPIYVSSATLALISAIVCHYYEVVIFEMACENKERGRENF